MPLSMNTEAEMIELVRRVPEEHLRFVVVEYLRNNCTPADLLFFMGCLEADLFHHGKTDATKIFHEIRSLIDEMRDEINTV